MKHHRDLVAEVLSEAASMVWREAIAHQALDLKWPAVCEQGFIQAQQLYTTIGQASACILHTAWFDEYDGGMCRLHPILDETLRAAWILGGESICSQPRHTVKFKPCRKALFDGDVWDTWHAICAIMHQQSQAHVQRKPNLSFEVLYGGRPINITARKQPSKWRG